MAFFFPKSPTRGEESRGKEEAEEPLLERRNDKVVCAGSANTNVHRTYYCTKGGLRLLKV